MKSQIYNLYLSIVLFSLVGCSYKKVDAQPLFNITDTRTMLHKDGNISYQEFKSSYFSKGKWQVFKVPIYTDSFSNNKLIVAEEKDGYYLFDTTKMMGYLYFQNKLIDSIQRDSFLRNTMPVMARTPIYDLYNKAKSKQFLNQKKILILSYSPNSNDLFKVDTMKIYFDNKLKITENQLDFCYELSKIYKCTISKIEFIYNQKIAKEGIKFPKRKEKFELKRVDQWVLDSTIAKMIE